MKNLVITKPTLKDIPTLWKWGEENPYLWFSDSDKWYDKKTLKKLVQPHPGFLFLIARDGDVPIAMCYTHLLVAWAYCDSIYVDEAYRRQGIAKMLIEKTEEMLKRSWIETFVLHMKQNNQIAQKFYENLGFKKGNTFTFMLKELKVRK